MICEIYDDKFDAKYLHELFDLVQGRLRYRACNVANSNTWPYHQEGSHRLFGSSIFSRNHPNFIDYLDNQNAQNFFKMFEFICELKNISTRDVYLQRIDVNLQHSGCNGSLHVDAKDKVSSTVMVMPNPTWKQEWGGKFQLMDWRDNVIEEHDYVPGRVIIFPGKHPHRGLAPIVPNTPRYTTVYRIIPQEL